VTAHSDKERAAGNYKHGFGFHPLLDLALAQLPEDAKGSGLLVRADSGGATHSFLDHVAALGLCFSVGFDLTEQVREAILAIPEKARRPALTQAGEARDGAAVAELALDLSRWPHGTRAICRRKRPQPRRPALLHRRQRLSLPGLHHQPAGTADRAARTAPPPPRRRRGQDPLRQGRRPREAPLPRLPAERGLARASNTIATTRPASACSQASPAPDPAPHQVDRETPQPPPPNAHPPSTRPQRPAATPNETDERSGLAGARQSPLWSAPRAVGCESV
jgi:hypothetical protein